MNRDIERAQFKSWADIAANFPTLFLQCLGKDWRQSGCISTQTWAQQDAPMPVHRCTNTALLLLVLKPAPCLYCTQWITLHYFIRRGLWVIATVMALWNTPALTQSAESQLSLQKNNLLEDSSCATSSSAVISARAWTLSQQCSSQADCSYHTSLAAKYKLQRDAKLERDIWHPRLSLATGSLLASVSSLVNPSSWAAALMTLANCRSWVYLLSFGTVLHAQLFCSGRLPQLKQGSQWDTISHQNKQLSCFRGVQEKNESY